MKTFLTVFFFLVYSIVNCQSLSLFDVDASNFPTIRAKFYAFDAQGNQQRPKLSDLSLTENGIPRTITNISCPPLPKKERLSIVLLVDVSIFNRIENAKNVLTAWLDQLGIGQNEVAIVSYEKTTYINQDFTNDRLKLQHSINKLENLSTSENHDGALTRPITGAISVAEKGKYKRVVLLLSSCSHYDSTKTNEVIARANQANVSLNFVIFDRYDYTIELTNRMANNTGGFSINKLPVEDLESAKSAIAKIYQVVGGGGPCLIEWKSENNCLRGNININLSNVTIDTNGKSFYFTPLESVVSIEYEPLYYNFKNPKIGKTSRTEITIRAKNSDLIVTNVLSTNPSFKIEPNNFTIKSNQSRKISLIYTAKDSSYNFTKFTFETNVCNQQYIVTGGYDGIMPKESTIKVVHPNGGEKFIVGYDTVVKWEGIPESDMARIDFSTNNGESWEYLSNSKGLKFNWKNVPKILSSSCLIKVTHIVGLNNEIIKTSRGHKGGVKGLSFSPDGKFIASGCVDGAIKLWNVETNQLIRTFTGQNSFVEEVLFTKDGKSLVSASWDRSVKIWDVNSGQILKNLRSHTNSVRSLALSPDGKTIASGGEDRTIKLWDFDTGQLLQTMNVNNVTVTSLAFSPDGKILCSGEAGNGLIKFWDVSTGNEVFRITGENSPVTSVAFNNNGSILATGSWSRTIKLWEVSTGRLLKTLIGHTGYVYSVAISPDESKIISGSEDGTIKIWDMDSGQLLRTLNQNWSAVYSVTYSNDGFSFASGSYDNTVKVWNLDYLPIQSDQSDSVFSIVEPLGTSTDIAMGEVLLGDDKDSVVIDFVRNVGSWNFDVRSVSFRGADASAFSLVSGMPTYRVEPNSSHFGEFRFAPSRVGLHQAEVVIITQSDTIVQTISGEGIENQLQIHATFIDFGEVEVGNERTIVDTLVLKNVGFNAITIEDTKLLSPDVEQFTILSGGGHFTLGAGEERLITAQFKPKYIGRTSGRIGFEYAGVGSPAIAHLFGNGIGGLVYVPNDSGYVGDRKSIRLMLGNVKTEAIASIAPKFKAMLRIQNNLLAPINKANTFIQNDSMYFSLQGAIGTTSELAQIPIVVGLGNVDYSWIDIAEFTFLDAAENPVDYDFEKQHGSFKILGICQEGGARLIHSSTPLPLLMVSPNPSDGKATIELNLIEDGVSTVKIYNSNGFLMESYGFTTSGSRTIEVDTKNYSNGLYFITIETPTLFDKAKLMLVR